MARSAIILLLAAALTPAAWGQKARSHGYWFVAPGAASAHGFSDFTIHAGGGGEYALPKGFGAGAEIGALGATANYTDSVMGVASANGYYHFITDRRERLDPFVTAGYSLLFRSDTANAFNYGVGLNYWFRPSYAARVEFRDHYWSGPGVHFWGIRVGLSFSELWP